MTRSQVQCRHCGDNFDSRGKYNAHYRSIHQSQVRLDSDDDDKGLLQRSGTGKFVCDCGKEFQSGQSLKRHKTICEHENESEDSEQGTLTVMRWLIIEQSRNRESDNQSERLPIILDITYNLAVCSVCCTCIPSDWLSAHLRTEHGVTANEDDILTHLDIERPTMTSTEANTWKNSMWFLNTPIDGIPIISKEFYCRLCNYSCGKKRTMKNHFTNAHRGISRIANTNEAKVQNPFKGQLEKFFVVRQESRLDEQDWKTAFEKEFDEAVEAQEAYEHDESRLMSGFIAKNR